MKDSSDHLHITDHVCFSIGETAIAIENIVSKPDISIPSAYLPFITTAKESIRIALRIGQDRLSGPNPVFASPPIWSLYGGDGKKIFRIFSRMRQREHSLCLYEGNSYAEIQFSKDFQKPLDPFCGPALELLIIEHLAVSSGCLLHGCGLRTSDRGILFAGPSGAGKSTMLRLWEKQKDTLILSDDRTIAQYSSGSIKIYGTPWHGKVRKGVPHGAGLAGIFFLKHGSGNHMRKLSADSVVHHLLRCSFPPFWDARGVAAALEFFNIIGREIPCYELEFVPDTGVVDFISQWLFKS